MWGGVSFVSGEAGLVWLDHAQSVDEGEEPVRKFIHRQADARLVISTGRAPREGAVDFYDALKVVDPFECSVNPQ